MRVFEIEPGWATPHHSHPWEHEMFIVKGLGYLKAATREKPLKEGDAVMVLPNEQHGVSIRGKPADDDMCRAASGRPDARDAENRLGKT